METEAIHNKRFQFHDMDAAVHRHTFARDVAFGLTAPQNWLPPSIFMTSAAPNSTKGTASPKYYLYRAELEIFSTDAAEIHAQIGHWALVEFSGNAGKTRYLLQAMNGRGNRFAIVR